MIHDLDGIINNSLHYIASATHSKMFDVMNTYVRAYERHSKYLVTKIKKQPLQYKRKAINISEDEHIKIHALQVTGRYHRMYQQYYDGRTK